MEGNQIPYITHYLDIERADEPFLQEQIELFVSVALRGLHRTVRPSASVLLFSWDVVECQLTVTGHDDALSYDETHVDKVGLWPWDEVDNAPPMMSSGSTQKITKINKDQSG